MSVVFTVITTTIFFFVPPVNWLVVTALLIVLGLAIAGWGTLGIYYLRRFWGPKTQPRTLLRSSLRQATLLAGGILILLILRILDSINLLTLFITIGLIVVIERLI